MFVLGLILALFAVWKGYSADEPFPGYGDKYRACDKEKALVAEHLDAYRNHLDGQSNRAKSEIRALFRNAAACIGQWSKNVNLVERRFVDYRAAMEHMEKEYANAWDIYWRAYIDNRVEENGISRAPKRAPLFEDASERDPRHVFSDVKRLYLNDEQRKKQEDAYKKGVSEQKNLSQEVLQKAMAERKARLGRLVKDSTCHI